MTTGYAISSDNGMSKLRIYTKRRMLQKYKKQDKSYEELIVVYLSKQEIHICQRSNKCKEEIYKKKMFKNIWQGKNRNIMPEKQKAY